MDLRYTEEEQAFRAHVRSRLLSEIPAGIREKCRSGQPLDKADVVASHRILHSLGWAVPHWPREWGGQDWTPVQRFILQDEISLACVPPALSANVSMVGPVLAAFGSPAQKERFLPRVANLDDWWCQGFSEPNAGSDLASLRMSAIRGADGYVVSGQKIWTTYAQHADWMFALVRTDLQAKPQRGISFVLIDMKSPGISLRPILLLNDEQEVNEVFFDNVEVPFENLVGAENHGWDYAKYLLAHERTSIAGTGVVKELIQRIGQLARRGIEGREPLWNDGHFRHRLVELEADLSALEVTQLRVAASLRLDTTMEMAASLLKVRGSELQQRAIELLMDVGGPQACLAAGETDADWARHSTGNYMNWRKLSIYGGSNEIQRNIMAKTLLGN